MPTHLQRKIIRGVLALGLAMSFSDSCLSAPKSEERRSDEKFLSLNIEERHLPMVAQQSRRRIKIHIQNALDNVSSGEYISGKTHVKMARDILSASLSLMPYMNLFDLLHETRHEILNGDRYIFNHNLLAINKELSRLSGYFPEEAFDLKQKLTRLYSESETMENDELAVKLSSVIADYSQKTGYIPYFSLQSCLYNVEHEIGKETPNQLKLESVLQDAGNLLEVADMDYQTPLDRIRFG